MYNCLWQHPFHQMVWDSRKLLHGQSEQTPTKRTYQLSEQGKLFIASPRAINQSHSDSYEMSGITVIKYSFTKNAYWVPNISRHLSNTEWNSRLWALPVLRQVTTEEEVMFCVASSQRLNVVLCFWEEITVFPFLCSLCSLYIFNFHVQFLQHERIFWTIFY